MATADVSPYGNPGTAEQGVQPAGVNTPATAGWPTDMATRVKDIPEDDGKMLRPLKVGWPRGKKSFPAQHSGQILEPTQQHSEAEEAALQAHYESLKPSATEAAREYVLSRTPARWQSDMTDLIEADWPVPEPPEPEVESGATGRQNQDDMLARDDGQVRHQANLNPMMNPNLNPNPNQNYDPNVSMTPQPPQDPTLPR